MTPKSLGHRSLRWRGPATDASLFVTAVILLCTDHMALQALGVVLFGFGVFAQADNAQWRRREDRLYLLQRMRAQRRRAKGGVS